MRGASILCGCLCIGLIALAVIILRVDGVDGIFGVFISLLLIIATGRGAPRLWKLGGMSRAQAEAHDRRESREYLRNIVAREDFADVPVVDSGEYAEKSDELLLDIFERTDPARAGRRYHALVSELRRRAHGDVE